NILLNIEKLLKRDIPISVKEKAEVVLQEIKGS
ncbi:HEAT repeat domain-containing protein, partial [Listeria monocytogenes]|nr:HEAT repeat domain-containing protein [Listeria monocytogenes]